MFWPEGFGGLCRHPFTVASQRHAGPIGCVLPIDTEPNDLLPSRSYAEHVRLIALLLRPCPRGSCLRPCLSRAQFLDFVYLPSSAASAICCNRNSAARRLTPRRCIPCSAPKEDRRAVCAAVKAARSLYSSPNLTERSIGRSKRSGLLARKVHSAAGEKKIPSTTNPEESYYV